MTKEIQIKTIEVLNEKEAAKYICMIRSFSKSRSYDGYRIGRTPGPRYMKLGRSIRYPRQNLDGLARILLHDFNSIQKAVATRLSVK